MPVPLTRLAPRLRLVIARRPWIRWLVVLSLATAAGLSAAHELGRVDAARRSWSSTQVVAVAQHDHEPGDTLQTTRVELPIAAIADTAISDIAPGARARQRITAGEVVVLADITVGIGPAAGAPDGAIVVPISDPLIADAPIGATVAVYADGLVLAEGAEIVDVHTDVAFVAVDARDAPLVAAASHSRSASIVFPR